ncbi:unnamed protein product [Effrenium voratum]|nr:unnamed protein product [Effrenium voratum]
MPPVSLRPKSTRPKMRRKVLVIGIAGCSGCGKSTLAQKLVQSLGSPLAPVSLDWYLIPKWMPKVASYGRNWETPEGVDWKMMRQNIQTAVDVLSQADTVPEVLKMGPDNADVVQKGQAGSPLDEKTVVLVVEGFLLFYDDILAEMLHIKIWVEASFQTCLQRRHKRGKASRKRDVGDSEAWFRDLIWAYYEQYKSKQLNNAVNALHVDGDVCKEDLLSQCLPYCRRMVAARVQVVLLPHQKGAHSEDRCLRPARAKRALEEPSDRQPPRLRPRQVPRTSGSHAAYY